MRIVFKSVLIITLLLLIGILIFITFHDRPIDVQPFDLEMYQYQVMTFSCDTNVGEIKTSEDLLEKAMQIWEKEFQNIRQTTKNIEVFYDAENNCWCAKGVLRKNQLGGTPYVLVKQNGDVLAVWHTQ